MALWRLGCTKTSSTTNVTLVQASRVAGKVGGEVDLFPPVFGAKVRLTSCIMLVQFEVDDIDGHFRTLAMY